MKLKELEQGDIFYWADRDGEAHGPRLCVGFAPNTAMAHLDGLHAKYTPGNEVVIVWNLADGYKNLKYGFTFLTISDSYKITKLEKASIVIEEVAQ